MKMIPEIILKRLSLVFVFFFLNSCISYFGDFNKAQRFLKKGNCQKAHKHFYFSKSSDIKFIQKAIAVCEKKDIKTTILFYKDLLAQLRDKTHRMKVQKKLAEIFLKLKNYSQALKYYEALLLKVKTKQEKFEIQYKISFSFLKLKNYSQALVEVDKTLLFAISEKNKKEALLLKGRVLIAQESLPVAIEFFKKQIQKDPGRANSFRETLAFLFEQQGELAHAVEELKKISPQTSFSRKKIQSLLKRLENQPGAYL